VVQSGQSENTPKELKTPGMRAVYNNLKVSGGLGVADSRLTLALSVDEAVRRVRPDDWRGHQAKENEIKRALLPLLANDHEEVERIFLIIRQQGEY